ncbi:MAG: hypothetical protein LOD94_13260 [Gammaproteobacteria bacterium]
MSRGKTLLAGIAAVLVLAAGYLIFELGRHQAGYSLLEHRREVERQRNLISEQAQTIEELRRELAIVTTSREIDRETYARVEQTLTALEAKLQAQEEELAFYRGIIQPSDGETGLRVQSVEVGPTASERGYVLRIVLMQAIAQNRRVEGVVRLSVAGRRDGAAEKLGLAELSGDGRSEREYGFRYFQGLEQELVLPVGFEPVAIEIEVRPSAPRGEPTTYTFDWAAARGDDDHQGGIADVQN